MVHPFICVVDDFFFSKIISRGVVCQNHMLSNNVCNGVQVMGQANFNPFSSVVIIIVKTGCFTDVMQQGTCNYPIHG